MKILYNSNNYKQRVLAFIFLSLLLIFSCVNNIIIASTPLERLKETTPDTAKYDPWTDALTSVGLNDTITGSTTEALLNKDARTMTKAFKTGETVDRTDMVNTALDDVWDIFHDVLTALIAFGMLTAVFVTLFNFIKMATMPSHPMQRRTCMESIVMSVICIVLLSGLGLILNIIYSTFGESLSSGLIYAKDWRFPATYLLAQYGDLIVGFSGIASLTMLLCLGMAFMKLITCGGNPQKKQSAITGILTTTIATAGVGGVTTVISLLGGMITIA